MESQTNRRAGLPPALQAELRGLLGDRLSMAEAVRAQHGRDESHHDPHPPDAVVFPVSTEEVAAVVRACAAARVPSIRPRSVPQ